MESIMKLLQTSYLINILRIEFESAGNNSGYCTSLPRGLRLRSAAARLLRLWVQIPPGAWMLVCCECYVLSGRGLCYELITRPDESY